MMWHESARELKALNPELRHADIALLLGVSRTAVTKALNPERTRKWTRRDNIRRRPQRRAWDRENYERIRKDLCECGTPKKMGSDLCQRCCNAQRGSHRPTIEQLWADGRSIREIRAVTGIAAWTPGPYRVSGWDLPYRYKVAAR